jgi:hypothetical protein
MPMLSLSAKPANDNENRGYVYFMFADTGHMKIGVAKDPEARRRTLQTGCPVRIQLGGAWDTAHHGVDPYEVERALHLIFTPYKTRGEWFETPSDHDFIRRQKIIWAHVAYPYLYEQWHRRFTQAKPD